jgi:hypothetical protein
MVHFRNEPIVVVINPKVRVEHYFIPTNNGNKLLPATKKKKKKEKKRRKKKRVFSDVRGFNLSLNVSYMLLVTFF